MNNCSIRIALGIILAYITFQDIRVKKISVYALAAGTITIAILQVLCGKTGILSCVGGLLIGLSLAGISILTRGQIGLGDGAVFCMTGLGLGFWNNALLLSFSLFAAALFSIGLWVVKRIPRQKTIAFMPFVYLSYLTVLILC